MSEWRLGKWKEMNFFPRCWFLLSLVAFCVLVAGMMVRRVYDSTALITALVILVTIIALCIPGRHVPILARIVAVPFVLMYLAQCLDDILHGSLLSGQYWNPARFFEVFLTPKRRVSEYQPMKFYFLFVSVGILITGKWISSPSDLRRAMSERKRSYSNS